MRWRLHERAVWQAFREAVLPSGTGKRATSHGLQHPSATQLLEAGYDIRTVQELSGHKGVQSTMGDVHVFNSGRCPVKSALDDPVGAAAVFDCGRLPSNTGAGRPVRRPPLSPASRRAPPAPTRDGPR